MAIGNPAPLGLLAFGMTTMLLMYVDMGWVEDEFQEMVIGYAFFYGGLCQLLVGIFELFRGSTFPFAVFGSYGAFWLGWGLVHLMNEADQFTFSGDYSNGKTGWLIQWGLLTFCFWVVSLRKNMCLIITLGLLHWTFFLLAAANASGNAGVKKAAGAIGFLTAIAAWYTAMAEIVNEEWGRHVLPGLQPRIMPERIAISKDSIVKRADYDPKSKTMFLQFRGMQIKTLQDVSAIKEGVEEAMKGTGEARVHVVVDYEDALLLDDVALDYWKMVNELQREYYLSAKRFHISSFGTKGRMLQQGGGFQLNDSFLEGEQPKNPSGRM
jgi:succinate-acetate transporter protein